MYRRDEFDIGLFSGLFAGSLLLGLLTLEGTQVPVATAPPKTADAVDPFCTNGVRSSGLDPRACDNKRVARTALAHAANKIRLSPSDPVELRGFE